MFSWFQVDPNEPMPRSRLPILIALILAGVMGLIILGIVEWALSLS